MSQKSINFNEDKNTFVEHKQKRHSKKCFLCNHNFTSAKKYNLFCKYCKDHDERYRFSDWVPSYSFKN